MFGIKPFIKVTKQVEKHCISVKVKRPSTYLQHVMFDIKPLIKVTKLQQNKWRSQVPCRTSLASQHGNELRK
jgi:hypothetical protein